MGGYIKRIAAPKSWPILRKGAQYVTKPRAGAHNLQRGIPLGVLLVDLIKQARTTGEAKKILKLNEILVDGVRRTDVKFIVGLMDTIAISGINKYYRVIINKKGKIVIVDISKEESSIKPCRIINKSLYKGKVQLNLYDGRNILVEKDDFKTGDTVVLKVPQQEIKDTIKLEKGVSVFLTGGKHIGEIGVIEDIIGNKAKYKLSSGDVVETPKNYVFPIGKDSPVVKLG